MRHTITLHKGVCMIMRGWILTTGTTLVLSRQLVSDPWKYDFVGIWPSTRDQEVALRLIFI